MADIIIEPIRSTEYELVRLLADITPENLNIGADFGAPVGKAFL